MTPTKKQPLFIISGASGVGKSTLCEVLFRQETDYIVLESDILWHEVYNTPEDDYRVYRQMCLSLCANVAQIGKPVVLCGCATPKQFEALPERTLFTGNHHLAIVSENESLEDKTRNGREISDEKWIASSIHFNDWLKTNGEASGMTLLDNSSLTPQEGAEIVDGWIKEKSGISGMLNKT